MIEKFKRLTINTRKKQKSTERNSILYQYHCLCRNVRDSLMKYQNIAVPMENLSRKTTFPSKMNKFYYPLKLFANARSKYSLFSDFCSNYNMHYQQHIHFVFMTYHTWYIYQPSLLSFYKEYITLKIGRTIT